MVDCRNVLPNLNAAQKFLNPARGLAALATGFAEAVNKLYRMPVNIEGGVSRTHADMSKPESNLTFDSHVVDRARSRKRNADIHQTNKVKKRRHSRSSPTFADISQATERLYSATCTKPGLNVDTAADFKFSTATRLALQTTSDADHIQLVVVDKAHLRAAIVIERHMWDKQQHIMVWTEFPEDSPEDGMTIDYFACKQERYSSTRSKWLLQPDDQPLSLLSHQASEAFAQYMNSLMT